MFFVEKRPVVPMIWLAFPGFRFLFPTELILLSVDKAGGHPCRVFWEIEQTLIGSDESSISFWNSGELDFWSLTT